MWSENATNNFFISQTSLHVSVITIVMAFIRVVSKILILLQYIHCIHDYEAYLLLLNLYLYNIEEVLNMQLFT
jgi:hypothetical protein